jgi:NADH-quinone oxidoreductase subunit A
MLIAYATIVAFALVAVGFVLVALVAGKLLRPRFTSAATAETYECGEAPVSQAWFNFNPRFYIVTLIFIVFDVEIAFVYPVAVVLKRWVEAGYGVFALLEIGLFIAILLVGLAYVWKKGDLEWIRALRHHEDDPFVEPVRVVPAAPALAEPAAEDAA